MNRDIPVFHHDSNARHHPRIQMLEAVFGDSGYAWFFKFCEVLRERGENRLPEILIPGVALDFHADVDRFREFLQLAVQIGCFSLDANGYGSERMDLNMEALNRKRQQSRDNIKKRWDAQAKKESKESQDPNTDVIPPYKNSNTDEIGSLTLTLTTTTDSSSLKEGGAGETKSPSSEWESVEDDDPRHSSPPKIKNNRPKSKRITIYDVPRPESLDRPEIEVALRKFEAHLREFTPPKQITMTGIGEIYAEFDGRPDELLKAIAYSCRNGYRKLVRDPGSQDSKSPGGTSGSKSKFEKTLNALGASV